MSHHNNYDRHRSGDKKVHTVKTHFWEDGVLTVVERSFYNAAIALEHAVQHAVEGILVKVYNEVDELIHCFNDAAHDSYA